MLGGARFGVNRYARHYVDLLAHLADEPIVLVELGVLQGAGLAVWCDVFPRARVIGLDIDPGLCNLSTLEARGAFSKSRPELYELDELSPGASLELAHILDGQRIDVFIDDALHDDRSILRAARSFMPLMAERCFYFVEDNSTAWKALSAQWPALEIVRRKNLTCLKTRGSA